MIALTDSHTLSEINAVLDPGFESGAFGTWINVESVSENQIQSSIVNSGSYALRMDSIYYIYAYVNQILTAPLPLSADSRFTASIYPTLTGITCGEYGQARINIVVNNTDTGIARNLMYVWSGYNYPGTDTGSNVTRAHFLYYYWAPNQWHTINRSIVSDYSSVFGVTDASSLEVIAINLLNHASNGEPGTFYVDDIYLSSAEAFPKLENWHHDCSNTTGFVYNDEWDMNWMPWDIQNGSLTSDGSVLSVTSVVSGTGWHGPVFEYELPQVLRVRDIDNFSAFLHADNSLNAYLGYEVLMLGDSNRTPVIFFSFHDGWADYRQGSFGVAYVFTDGTYVGHGSGYPVGWTSFNGIMNASYTEAGLLAYVDGFGEAILPGLTMSDFNREIKYIAVASARYGSAPLIPVQIDEIYINHLQPSEIPEPFISQTEDISYEVGTAGHVIEWTIGNFVPTSYELYRDGGLLVSNAWPGGTVISFNIDNLAPGSHNYTIIISGGSGVNVSDTVIATVTDSTSPSVGQPTNILYQYGSVGHSIVWSVSDLYPGNYSIFMNEQLIVSDNWTTGSIVIDIDGLALGNYIFSILVSDSSSNLASDSVLVTIVDTLAPKINHPSDIFVNLDAESIHIIWEPTDLLPFIYEVYQNGTLVSSGIWRSGENITYTLAENLVVGTYNITIRVWDTSGNIAIDTVIVSIEQGSSSILGDYLGISISIGSIVVIVIIAGLVLRKQAGPP